MSRMKDEGARTSSFKRVGVRNKPKAVEPHVIDFMEKMEIGGFSLEQKTKKRKNENTN